MGSDRPDEFETISRLLAPLAGHPAARGLIDDAAVLSPPAGKTLVLTHDTLVEGVHFLATDPPDTVAAKLLRVNLSDLAAKGAEPFGYLMSCAWPATCDWEWRGAFAQGLADDQRRFGLTLLGGDTVSTPGPLTLGATLIGWGEPGRTPGRDRARAGDLLLVSGTIGDGHLGLLAAQGAQEGFSESDAAWLVDRYRRPPPRLELAGLIVRHAGASTDVSDGLIADIGNLARASGQAMTVNLEDVPLSEPARAWVERQPDRTAALVRLVTGGDDYEVAFAAPADHRAEIERQAEAAGRSVSVIGRVRAGEGVRVLFQGEDIPVSSAGWRHR